MILASQSEEEEEEEGAKGSVTRKHNLSLPLHPLHYVPQHFHFLIKSLFLSLSLSLSLSLHPHVAHRTRLADNLLQRLGRPSSDAT